MAAMTTETDALAERDRLYAELDAARGPFLTQKAKGPVDPMVKARHDQAQRAVTDHRRMWREIGQFVGDRPLGPDGEDALGVAVVDREAKPAALGKASR